MSEIPAANQGLPEAEAVNDTLLRDYMYDPLSGDYERFVHCLDRAAPIQGYFTPTMTPELGKAPEHIRDQWVGLRLPVRSKQYSEQADKEGFVIRAREALEVLKAQQPEAYEWWRAHYIQTREDANQVAIIEYNENHDDRWDEFRDGDPIPENPDFPEYGANMNWFIFFPEEGVFVPTPESRESLGREPLVRAAGEHTVRHAADG